jgi:hypothetical protein
MWNPESDVFVCKCGLEVQPDEVIEGATGLLKPLHNQVALESFQAQELAKLFSADAGARRGWLAKHYGPDYPDDDEMEQLIEDFLYVSHRRDGCTATFECPKCKRLALLYDVNEEWRFYTPEDK